GASVKAGGEDAGEEAPVEARVTRHARAIACAPIEGQGMLHGRSLARAPLAGAPGRRPRPEAAVLLSAGPIACSPDMSARYFHGWNVVAATFVMALFSFGLGFYGLSVYVATLQRLLRWSGSTGVVHV